MILLIPSKLMSCLGNVRCGVLLFQEYPATYLYTEKAVTDGRVSCIRHLIILEIDVTLSCDQLDSSFDATVFCQVIFINEGSGEFDKGP